MWGKLLQFVIHRGVTQFAPLHGPVGFKTCSAFHIRLLLDTSTLLRHCSFYRIVANIMILLPGIVLCCWNTSASNNIANMVCCQIQCWFRILCFLPTLQIKGLINIAQMLIAFVLFHSFYPCYKSTLTNTHSHK